VDGPSILLALSGHAELNYESKAGCLTISRGSVFFIGSGEQVQMKNIQKKEEMLLFQAYCDLVK